MLVAIVTAWVRDPHLRNQPYVQPQMQERLLHRRHQAYLRPLEATISVSRATFSGLALRSWYALQFFGSTATTMCEKLQAHYDRFTWAKHQLKCIHKD